ncbi:MAG: hypothetical protein ACXAC7_17470, partial [Candidatus Hodarchaeales archaeon]
MTSGLEECEEILKEGTDLSEIDNPTNEQLFDTAQSFFESALCFDRNGKRILAAKYFTLAADFFMTIAEEDKAAECYGKAILRNLMADNLEAAQVLMVKGDQYGDNFDTFHFRMAKDTFTRRIEDEIDRIEEEDRAQPLFETESSEDGISLFEEEDDLFSSELEEIDINELKLETQSYISLKQEDASSKSTIISSVKAFNLIEQEATKIDSSFSEKVALS